MRKTRQIAFTLLAVAAVATVTALAVDKQSDKAEKGTITIKSNGEAVAIVQVLQRGGGIHLKSDSPITFDVKQNRTTLAKRSTVTLERDGQTVFQIKADEIEMVGDAK